MHHSGEVISVSARMTNAFPVSIIRQTASKTHPLPNKSHFESLKRRQNLSFLNECYSLCFQVQKQVNVSSDLDLCFHLSPISTFPNKLCCLELITNIWASFVRKNVGSPEVWWDSWRASVTLAVNQGCITILLSPPSIEIMLKLLLGLELYFVLEPFHPPCNSPSNRLLQSGNLCSSHIWSR